jgi:hypothetical protein
MKKLTLLFAIVLLSLCSFAQQLENQLYFRGGYSTSNWSQFGLTEEDWNSKGFDSKYGAHFEVGHIFMLNRILKSDNMAIGINVDYAYANLHNYSGNNDDFENLGSLRLGSKIGPSFTYSPVEKMAIDIYAKMDILWGGSAVLYHDTPDDADDYYSGYGAVGFSTGLNFRYGLLILGIEFDTISKKLESDDYPGTYFQDDIDKITGEDSGDKSKFPSLNFTIGMSF